LWPDERRIPVKELVIWITGIILIIIVLVWIISAAVIHIGIKQDSAEEEENSNSSYK